MLVEEMSLLITLTQMEKLALAERARLTQETLILNLNQTTLRIRGPT